MNRSSEPQPEQSPAEPPHEEAADQQRKMVSLRLSAAARQILARLAREQGISQAAVLELLLRREAALVRTPQERDGPAARTLE